jgi:malate dehydrogenase (oxaloacetate-decarboxylating)
VGKPSKALASVVTEDELNAAYITPGVFNADLHTAVATAVGVPQADPPN